MIHGYLNVWALVVVCTFSFWTQILLELCRTLCSTSALGSVPASCLHGATLVVTTGGMRLWRQFPVVWAFWSPEQLPNSFSLILSVRVCLQESLKETYYAFPFSPFPLVYHRFFCECKSSAKLKSPKSCGREVSSHAQTILLLTHLKRLVSSAGDTSTDANVPIVICIIHVYMCWKCLNHNRVG